MRFDFNESNILNQNLFAVTDDKNILLSRLAVVLEDTDDLLLRKSVQSLIKKIECLSNEDVKRLLYLILKKKFIVTSNYKVIYNK